VPDRLGASRICAPMILSTVLWGWKVLPASWE
jgi:hypothetical protein